MTVLVATTLAPYVMGRDEEYWSSWISNREAFNFHECELFAALEVDGRGEKVFDELKGRMRQLGPSAFWSFSINNGDTEYTSSNRLSRICTGRNLITEYATQRGDITHILFLDADVRPADELVAELLLMDTGVCGADVPTYCLSGPPAPAYLFPQSWDVREHMNTAGCLLVRRDVFRALRWRWDGEAGMTDDPCYHADAKLLGHPTYVRHDTQCLHYPAVLPPMEQRGHDRSIRT